MTDISKEILEKYQIRKSKKQKTEFMEFMRAHFPELNVEEGGFAKNRNIVIGNVSTAKAVFGAHYDTCAAMPVPNFIMPKNMFVSFLYGVLIAVPILAVSILASGIVRSLTDNIVLFELTYFGFMFGMLYLMMAGPANKHTVNDNTSGIITLIELMSTMSPEERAQYAFVFFDNEELGLLGSSFFAKKHKEEMKDKLLINFDCVSDGDDILFIIDKKFYDEYAESLKSAFEQVDDKRISVESNRGVFYPSDQKNFKKNIGVAAFKKSRFGLYLGRIHTKRDTVMDERNIEVIIDGTLKFVENIG
ncbi:MAG: M28 family peptidase [Oscillospiraceae bacterium]|nr:M28 family peptidase [Oscillospiraceae bacterium]